VDAKNLEVLLRLKQAMEDSETEENPEKKPRPHVPGQGFSEESERIFQELAKKRLSGDGAPISKKQDQSSQPPARAKPKTPWPQPHARQAEDHQPRRKAESSGSREPAEWGRRICRFCKAEYVVNLLWSNIPIMCNGCRNERKTRYKPGEGDTLYAETKVFHGGGPGTGRRK
jgi:hypothetical protein